MNTIQQTPVSDSKSGSFLEPEMANLLQMTNYVLSTIKQQTSEMHQ